MIYETETTKAMTDRELAEAIVDDRIACGQFCEDDRNWLVEREMRETRESLVNGFNAIERWDDTYDDDEEFCEDDPRRICDGDLGQLLGDFEWQYDVDEVIDMMSEMDWSTCSRFWKRDEDMPTMEEIEGCKWAPITENVEHLLEWYGQHAETDIVDVDEEKVIEVLSEEGENGQRVWKDLTDDEVMSVIYETALVTSDNMGCYDADDMGSHIYAMCDVLEWIGCDNVRLPMDEEDEEHMLDSILVALTDEHQNWRYLTRAEAIQVVEDVVSV